MAYARKLLSATKRNTLNLLTAAQADSPTTANGWTAGGTSTSAASATVGPFGFGVAALMTTGGSGARTLKLTTGTFTHGGAKFSVFVKAGTATGLVLAVEDGSNALVHGAIFAVAAGVWSVSGLLSGAVAARVQPYTYDGGWVRLEVEFIPGAPGGGATVAADSMSAYIQLVGNGTTCEFFGAMLENGASTNYVVTSAGGDGVLFNAPIGCSKGNYGGSDAAVAEGYDLLVTDNQVYVDPTLLATQYKLDPVLRRVEFLYPPTVAHNIKCARRGSFASPYLVGLVSGVATDDRVIAGRALSYNGNRSLAGNEVPLWRPQRVRDEIGTFYTEWLNTPSGAMKLQGRSAPDAAWYTLISITEADLNADGQYSALVTLMPEMRIITPTIGNTTVTFTAWIDE